MSDDQQPNGSCSTPIDQNGGNQLDATVAAAAAACAAAQQELKSENLVGNGFGTSVGGGLQALARKRHRTPITQEQLQVLERSFQKYRYPDIYAREELARVTRHGSKCAAKNTGIGADLG
uniref:Homeobox domain-containing protein n=1 Tax=Panagrellus redivivus TaxID=6233 RepID=A0A7E4W4L2_PANRE